MCKEQCNCKTALDRELKTGDLIRVSHRCETGLQVFLFETNCSIWYVNLEDCNEKGFPTDSHDIRVAARHLVSPVQKVLRVKKASEIVKWLEDNGFLIDSFGWYKPGMSTCFSFATLELCDNDYDPEDDLPKEWLEESYV